MSAGEDRIGAGFAALVGVGAVLAGAGVATSDHYAFRDMLNAVETAVYLLAFVALVAIGASLYAWLNRSPRPAEPPVVRVVERVVLVLDPRTGELTEIEPAQRREIEGGQS